MPLENVPPETVEETAEPEVTETEVAPEQVETQKETETIESKTEIEETATEEIKEESTETEKPEEKPEDDVVDSTKELDLIQGKYKAEQKKVEDLKNQVKGLEAVVSTIVDAKLKDIPKEYHALIPEGSLSNKLEWINKAETSGLFKKAEIKDVEIGKPLNLGNKNEKANSNSTAQQKLSNYFSNFYSK